jgi:hypothetical protein
MGKQAGKQVGVRDKVNTHLHFCIFSLPHSHYVYSTSMLMEVIFHTSFIINSIAIKTYDYIFSDPWKTKIFTLKWCNLTSLFMPAGSCTKIYMFTCSQLWLAISTSGLAKEGSVNMCEHFVKDTAFINSNISRKHSIILYFYWDPMVLYRARRFPVPRQINQVHKLSTLILSPPPKKPDWWNANTINL